jgi:hypothetical protein
VWGVITADQELAASASCWHQGLLATARHPSLALVAHIASIEQTAKWLESGGRLAKSKGARQRVDAAIALVASDEERMILSPVYRIRSVRHTERRYTVPRQSRVPTSRLTTFQAIPWQALV